MSWCEHHCLKRSAGQKGTTPSRLPCVLPTVKGENPGWDHRTATPAGPEVPGTGLDVLDVTAGGREKGSGVRRHQARRPCRTERGCCT